MWFWLELFLKLERDAVFSKELLNGWESHSLRAGLNATLPGILSIIKIFYRFIWLPWPDQYALSRRMHSFSFTKLWLQWPLSITCPAFKHTLDWFNLIGHKRRSQVAGNITEEMFFFPQRSTHTEDALSSFFAHAAFLFLSCQMNIWLETKGELINYSSGRAPVAVVKSVDIWAFQTTSANLYAVHCARQPALYQKAVKGLVNLARTTPQRLLSSPLLGGIMHFTGVLPKAVGNLTLWCYWLHR